MITTPNQFTEYLDTISEYSDFDLSPYSDSINNRLMNFMESEQICSVFELRYKLKNDRQFHVKLLEGVTVRYTEVFRDPQFYLTLRNQVLPYLSTFSNIKIWVAGCATGEEVYSLAIWLHEYDMLEHSTIYATDINSDSLAVAERGVYHPTRIREYTLNYAKSGGRLHFGKYYSIKNDKLVMTEQLKSRVHFVKSDLLKDKPEGEFNMVLCRNVLFYFTEQYQKMVVDKVADSIRNYGYFATGVSEKICTKNIFSCIDHASKIYRKVI
ncbi:MAG: protein-glutamate O-methyltransferase CheR [Bacteroidetes bacterium]|nr:protein-glutamate O-methyltransferase CheR [Bacteroidota bacterium]